MSNLKELLHKRRSKFYEGATLKQHCDAFMEMVDDGAEIHDFGDTIIVLEQYGLEGNYRGWLLFDKFTRNTARAMQKVTDDFQGRSLYASTHDKRIADLLKKFGFSEYSRDENDYYLVKRGKLWDAVLLLQSKVL